MNSGSLALWIVLLFILGMFIIFEKKDTSIKEMSIIGTLAGIAGLLRVPFAGIPNVQPTTALVIITGWVFGPVLGFVVGAISVIVSNSFLGHGPWTPWQMLAWGLAGFVSGMIGKKNKRPSKYFLGFYGFVWGFLFDYILNLWHFLAFIYPRTLSSLMVVYLSSFYFDLLHSIFNLLFLYFFGNELIPLLSRFKDKLIITRIENKESGFINETK